eukprot:TRINITY_DN31150_c0_g1_i1.p1 TRINITY_DN31150_c0_g1~~TRINITY_DN31150_c0_g1_i1.p1  ORF type:complete len:281 (-),score=47.59 TRINITY_DN31150_c0_g1_i1:96-938(-)
MRATINRLFLVLLRFVYLPISSALLQFFNCLQVRNADSSSTFFIRTDMTLQCYDSTWYQVLPLVSVALLGYVVGIPATFLAVVIKNRKRLNHELFRATWAPLYADFASRCYYFDSVRLATRFLLTCVFPSLLLPNSYKLGLCISLQAVYLASLLFIWPHRFQADDKFVLLSQATILTILVGGVQANEEGEAPFWVCLLVTLSCIHVFLAGFFSFLFFVVLKPSLAVSAETRRRALRKLSLVSRMMGRTALSQKKQEEESKVEAVSPAPPLSAQAAVRTNR